MLLLWPQVPEKTRTVNGICARYWLMRAGVMNIPFSGGQKFTGNAGEKKFCKLDAGFFLYKSG